MSILLADIDATCAALGYSDGNNYHIEPEAIQGLKHLIWVLRRDSESHEYRKQIGKSKVLQTDLIHMVASNMEDDEFADVLIRLLIILTSPTLLLYRDGLPKDHHGQRKFLELVDILQRYKTAFSSEKVWSALFKKLQSVLKIEWSVRSEDQNLLIERILVLIRNVLQVPSNFEMDCQTENSTSVHDEIIWSLYQSGIMDLILFAVSSSDETQFHLHCLEILCLIYREQTAEALADLSGCRTFSQKQHDEQQLIAARNREKEVHVSRQILSRHPRFGGTFVLKNFKSVSQRDVICHQPLERVVSIDFDREKTQNRRPFRHIKESNQVARSSAYSIRLFLREYSIEILRSAYNNFVRQVRRVLESNSGPQSHDDSYLLWAIKFFMEFNRLNGMQFELVSESLSIQCFHWVLTRMQHHMDMITSDKKNARLWSKRLHLALQAYRELLFSLISLQKLKNEKAQGLFDMLFNNICYVMEYRETILYLLINYNETINTKTFLRDVIETAHIFTKMMNKFCEVPSLVQNVTKVKQNKPKRKTYHQNYHLTEEDLNNKWVAVSAEISMLLSSEFDDACKEIIPFDITQDKSVEAQKENCMLKIITYLRDDCYQEAILLLRAAREIWSDDNAFGSFSATPEDELLLLREIFMTTIQLNKSETNKEDFDDHSEEEQTEHGHAKSETTLKFEDFMKRFLHPKIVRACTLVLNDWQEISQKYIKASVTLLHRIAISCTSPAMLYQAKLFRIFQQVFLSSPNTQNEDLRRLGTFIIRKFIETSTSNKKIFAELLFYKTIRDANQLESGYCDDYDMNTKGAWSEEQEAELRFLFEENQRNPSSDQDVIDWILENLIDKTRTRRSVLKKLKELGLMFKAPTKKSLAKKGLWRGEEDDELQRLYGEYRIFEDCLQRLIEAFENRRSKEEIIKRLLQLHVIANRSEILPKLKKNKNGKKHNDNDNNHDEMISENDFWEEVKAQNNTQLKPKVKKQIHFDKNAVRQLRDVNIEKYKEAIDWLIETFGDAAAELNDCVEEEDDAIPLVPLESNVKEAMEDATFQELLMTLNMNPPITGMETYWRIPINITSTDMQLMAKVLSGKDVDLKQDNEVEKIEVEQNYEHDEEDKDENKEVIGKNYEHEDENKNKQEENENATDLNSKSDNVSNEHSEDEDTLMYGKRNSECSIEEYKPKRRRVAIISDDDDD